MEGNVGVWDQVREETGEMAFRVNEICNWGVGVILRTC